MKSPDFELEILKYLKTVIIPVKVNMSKNTKVIICLHLNFFLLILYTLSGRKRAFSALQTSY